MAKHLFNLHECILACVDMSSEKLGEGCVRDADAFRLRRLGMERVGGD